MKAREASVSFREVGASRPGSRDSRYQHQLSCHPPRADFQELRLPQCLSTRNHCRFSCGASEAQISRTCSMGSFSVLFSITNDEPAFCITNPQDVFCLQRFFNKDCAADCRPGLRARGACPDRTARPPRSLLPRSHATHPADRGIVKGYGKGEMLTMDEQCAIHDHCRPN
jgi:hypothetical protein